MQPVRPNLIIDTRGCSEQLGIMHQCPLNHWPFAFCAALARAEFLNPRPTSQRKPSTSIRFGGTGFLIKMGDMHGNTRHVEVIGRSLNLAALCLGDVQLEPDGLRELEQHAHEEKPLGHQQVLLAADNIIRRRDARGITIGEMAAFAMFKDYMLPGANIGRYADPLKQALGRLGSVPKNGTMELSDWVMWSQAELGGLFAKAQSETECLA